MSRKKITEHERREAWREYRRQKGTQPKLQEIDHSTGYDPQRAAREEQRLSATHDPARASACRVCGRAVRPDEDYREVAGWKTCLPCAEVIPHGVAAAWSAALSPLPVPVTTVEARELSEQGMPNPAFFHHGRWPADPGGEAWSHLDLLAAREALTALRAEAEAASVPKANSFQTGCAWCGRSTSVRWHTSPWRWGDKRSGAPMAVCDTCEPMVARSGARSGHPWRCSMFALAVGLRKPMMDWHFDLKAFYESGVGDGTGTSEPWGYLNGVRETLRWRVIRANPKLLTALTPREERILRLEKVDTEPPKATPLARLD